MALFFSCFPSFILYHFMSYLIELRSGSMAFHEAEREILEHEHAREQNGNFLKPSLCHSEYGAILIQGWRE